MSSTSSSSLQPLVKLPALDNTFGAWLLGTIFSALLQGTVYHQTYRYFRLYPKDPMYLKIWVIIVGILETLNTSLAIHAAYVYLVRNYFNPLSLVGEPVWSLCALPTPGALVAVVSQCFFARRLYIINRRYSAVVTIAMLCFLTFAGFYIALSIHCFKSKALSQVLTVSWLASAGSGFAMAGDSLVTAALTYVLRMNRSGVKKTDTMLDSLIAYAISTGESTQFLVYLLFKFAEEHPGLLICIFKVLNLVFCLKYPDNLIYAAISMILTKLYTSTFLVALNTRHSLVQRGLIGENETSVFNTTIRQPPKLSDLVIARRTVTMLSDTFESTEVPPSHHPVVELRMMGASSGNVSQDLDSEIAPDSVLDLGKKQ
ncbi:hypothetical protein C8Q70DRAFT_1053990 [Cubamyces menziesii]|nr:hypothetical protein C8Q70DRAFT_1053990 [Cubamyces menziesii]